MIDLRGIAIIVSLAGLLGNLLMSRVFGVEGVWSFFAFAGLGLLALIAASVRRSRTYAREWDLRSDEPLDTEGSTASDESWPPA